MYCILSYAKAIETAVYSTVVFFSYRGTLTWVSLLGRFGGVSFGSSVWFCGSGFGLALQGFYGGVQRLSCFWWVRVDCYGESWLTGAYSGSGLRLALGKGYHFMGELPIEIDFLLNLEFYV